MKICKKCDHPMELKSVLKKNRRGQKQENMPNEYYCPKCDHLEYDGS